MKNLFIRFAAVGLLGASATAADAQTTMPAAAYAGPRFPGGPDSLRALIYRSTRLTPAAPTGRMLVQFELKADGKPYNFTMVRPPLPLNKPLIEATAAALDYLEAHMPAWQPAPPSFGVSDKSATVNLPLDFTTPAAARPYDYADQNPSFDALTDLIKARHFSYLDAILADPTKLAAFKSSPGGVRMVIQLQVKYPPEALRGRQQGTVYVYFEVAENGAIEHPEILGTAGRALDAEVLKVLTKFPAATTPALLRGQPVRVSYVVPVTFKIQ